MTASMHEEPQRSTTALYEAAVAYAALGWHVIPLNPRSKVAAIEWRNGRVNYQEVAPTADELYMWFVDWTVEKRVNGIWTTVRFTEQPNIAVILRDDKVQLDFDGLGDRGGFSRWLSDHPSIVRLPKCRTGSGKIHIFFGVRSPIQHHDIPLPDGGVVEVRTGRNIAVLPPSLHPNGEPYVWEIAAPESGLPIIDPASVGVKARPKLTVVGHEYHEGDPLSEGEIDAIVRTVAPYWLPNHRHALSLAVPGWLARIGAPEEDARTVISRIANGDDRMAEYQRSVRDTYVKAAQSVATKGWSELRETLDEADLRLLSQIADDHTPVFSLNAKAKGITIPWQIDLADFLALDFPPDAWLVDGLISDIQLGMIAGEPGSMKSWKALYLALCVALGEPLYGTYYIPERKRVVYIQEENSASKLNRRISRLLAWMGKSPEDIRGWFTLITNQSFRIDKPEVMQRLADEVLTPQQPGLVIFDPMVEMHTKKENDNDEMTPLMAALRTIRDHYECVVILVHHVNKGVDITNFLYRIRGASSIAGALDFCIGVLREEGEADKSVVFWAKVRDDKKPSPFAIELIDNEDGSIRFAMHEGGVTQKVENKRGYTTDDILVLVNDTGRITLENIARALNLPIPPTKKYPEALRKTVLAMIDARLLKQVIGNPITVEMPDI